MPVALTYPGVYIEEIPSGVRTITGVATSIAAFVGWAPKGPTEGAELVLSFSDYVRRFGDPDPRSYLGYSVSHFFANGGQRAWIVRLAASDAVIAAAALKRGAATALTVKARSPGKWANDYAILIKYRTGDPTRFRLQVANIKADPTGKAVVESFDNLSMDPADPRNVNEVLKAGSALVTSTGTGNPPDETELLPDPVPAEFPGQKPGEVPNTSWLKDGDDGTVVKPHEDGEANGVAASATSALKHVDLFNLLCVPGLKAPPAVQTLQAYCQARRAFFIVDCAQDATHDSLKNGPTGITSNGAQNSALYFPWLVAPDPAQLNRPREFPPCGFIAGIYARTDAQRGVWKAPAGSESGLTGVVDVLKPLTDDENGTLNPLGINCIRNFPVYGIVSWGARTLHGNDERGSEWKYVPVRRTALFIEETLYRATKWVVFEPNDEPLWAQIRLNIGAFMHDLFRQGAFQGATPKDAYFVKCDKETTTQSDINRGVVNIVVGFAPLKPAEFVVIKLTQIAGDIQT